MSVNNLLNSLDRVRKMGADRWVACCPAHNDKSPSLAIRELSDGAVLFIASPVALLTKSLAQLALICRNCSPKNRSITFRDRNIRLAHAKYWLVWCQKRSWSR